MSTAKRYSVSLDERARSPYWQARIYLEGEGGVPRRWSTGVPIGSDRRVSAREATRAAEERADELAREVLSQVDASSDTALDSVAERLLAHKTVSGRRSRAVDAVAFNLEKHVLPHFGPTRDVRTIRRRDLEAFKSAMAKKTSAPTSINNALTAIRQLLKFACNIEERIEAIPHVDNVKVPKKSKVAMPITEQQAARFLESFKDDETEEREFNLFLLNTGLRKFEALAVRWDWIDWTASELHIPGEVRKGGKEQRSPTALNPAALALLEARQGRAGQPSKGRVWFQLKTYDKARRDAAKRAGIAGYRHHDARHTRATWMGRDGASAIELRDAFNWETLEMVSRYTHPDRTRQHALAAGASVGAPTQKRGKLESIHAKPRRARS